MKLAINALQAGEVFNILAKFGNLDDSDLSYFQYKKDEFIGYCAEGISEYWYPSKCGSSIKVYFDGWVEQSIRVYAQTLNTQKEATLVEDTNKALLAYIVSERQAAQV